jgi:hypothetical protein
VRQHSPVDERTSAGDELHATVDVLVAALSVDDEGQRLADDEETDTAIEDARASLQVYQGASPGEHTPAADALAQALQALFDWAQQSLDERGDFKVTLYALEMARYQYGGESASLDVSPFK